MQLSVIAWTQEGRAECGHAFGPGDVAYVIRPVIGMHAVTSVCEACGKPYVRAYQKLARLPGPDRFRAGHHAQAAADARRGEGMLSAARAWLTYVEALAP